MEHTLRAMQISIAPMGVFMTASEANRQRVLALLLAESEQMCTSLRATTDYPMGGARRFPIRWPSALPQSRPVTATGSEKVQTRLETN